MYYFTLRFGVILKNIFSIIATSIYIFVSFSCFFFHRMSHNRMVCRLWQGVKTSPGTLSATTRPADVLGLNCSTVTIGWLACEQLFLQDIVRNICIPSFRYFAPLSCDAVRTTCQCQIMILPRIVRLSQSLLTLGYSFTIC